MNISDVEKIKHAQRDFCRKCEEKNGRKSYDECSKCEFNTITNIAYKDALRGIK